MAIHRKDFLVFTGHTVFVRKGVYALDDTVFWCGMGAGLVLGAAVGMLISPRQKSMKTCVGRTMQHMGNAVDDAWDDFRRTMK